MDRFYYLIGCIIGMFIMAIKYTFNLVLLAVGAVAAGALATAEMLNVRIIPTFIMGLFVMLFWNHGIAVAFSPYLVAPIGYLNAVAIYVLFRAFFGNLFPKITIGVPLSDDEKRLVQIFRTTKPPTPGSGYAPGPRQAFAGAAGPGQSAKGPTCDGPGRTDRNPGRQETATAGAK